MAIVEFLTTENEVHLTNNVYSQVAHRRFLVGDAARTQKNPRNLKFSLIYAAKSVHIA
jgi:hypothetical protein